MSNYVIYNRETGEVEGNVFTTNTRSLQGHPDNRIGFIKSSAPVDPREYMVVEEVDEEEGTYLQHRLVKQKNTRITELMRRTKNAITRNATRKTEPIRDHRTETGPDRVASEPAKDTAKQD